MENSNTGTPAMPPANNMQNQPADNQAQLAEARKKKKKEKALKTLVRTIIILAIIALGSFAILWVVSRAGKYESIGEMLRQMFVDLDLMWKRVRN